MQVKRRFTEQLAEHEAMVLMDAVKVVDRGRRQACKAAVYEAASKRTQGLTTLKQQNEQIEGIVPLAVVEIIRAYMGRQSSHPVNDRPNRRET